MSAPERSRRMPLFLATIKGRLIAGAGLLLGLLATATLIGYVTVGQLVRELDASLASLQQSSSIGSEFEALILDQIDAAEGYLTRQDSVAERGFSSSGLRAQDMRRRYKALPGLTPSELAQIESVEDLHSKMEVDYALAMAQLDNGHRGAANAMAVTAREEAQHVRHAILGITRGQSVKVATAAGALTTRAHHRQAVLVGMLLVALLTAALVMWLTIRGIDAPLAVLLDGATRLGRGDLRMRIEGPMPAELGSLAHAFNLTAEQLRTIVSETIGTADHIARSASDVSSISEQVSASSQEVAAAMLEITHGAEVQSQELRSTREALEQMTIGAGEIDRAAGSVEALGVEIHAVASRSRERVSSALGLLLDLRQVVESSAGEVGELERASGQIDEFVETISAIAGQTNLLALNAAIEAARAGEHGRGFAVVAAEVQKLADESARAARQVAQNVRTIRSRIESVVATMGQGTQKVAGVEQVSRDADTALEQIMTAVEGVREAAARVAAAAERNRTGIDGIQTAVGAVAGTAESHAASAEEVSAAAEEQSASTEVLSAATSQLQAAADQLKQLVEGFET